MCTEVKQYKTSQDQSLTISHLQKATHFQPFQLFLLECLKSMLTLLSLGLSQTTKFQVKYSVFIPKLCKYYLLSTAEPKVHNMLTLFIHFMLCWNFYLCLVFYLFPNSSQFNSAIETILILISLKIQSISENQLQFLPLTFSPALIWAISELTNRAVILRNSFSGLYWMQFIGSLFSFLVYAHVLVVSREKVHGRQIC